MIMTKMFLASTLVNDSREKMDEEKLERNRIIREKLKGGGIDVLLPQENEGSMEEVYRKNMKDIDDADGIIAAVSDTSTMMFVEVGYAVGQGKKAFALNLEGAKKSGHLSTWHFSFEKIFESVDEMAEYFAKSKRENPAEA